MGLGLQTSGGGGDFLDFVKYDARAGRVFRSNKVDGVDLPVDITKNFKAVFDLENIQVGWMRFGAGVGPDMHLVPLGQPLPPQPPNPSGDKATAYKQGFRVVIKLSAGCGGDVREMSSSAGVTISAIDTLYDAWKAGLAENPGKLPVVALLDAEPITSGSGAKKSTNYRPDFSIIGWATRPADLVPSTRGSTAAPAPAAPVREAVPMPVTALVRPHVRPPTAVAAPGTVDDDFG